MVGTRGGEDVRVLLDDEPEPPVRRRRSGPRRSSVLLLALVLLLVSAVQARQAGRVGQRLAHPVALSTSLAEPLEVAWRRAADGLLGVPGDLVLLAQRDGARVVAIDPADGSEVWRAPQPIDPGWCALAAQAPDPVLVCSRGAESTLVTVLDPASGETVADHAWRGAPTMVLPVGGDLVIAGSDDAGRMVAERWSPGTDNTVWSFRSEPDVVAPVSTAWDAGEGWLAVRSAGRVAISLDDGAQLAEVPGEETSGGQGEGSGGGSAEGPAGEPLTVMAGDADARGLELTDAGGALTRLDADGAPVWTYRATASGGTLPYPLLTVGGVLVCGVGGSVAAVDLATGSELWSVATGLTQAGAAVTDGSWVAVAERNEAGTALVARDPRTGQVHWRLPLPDSPVARLTLAGDGTVLVATTDEVVALHARP